MKRSLSARASLIAKAKSLTRLTSALQARLIKTEYKLWRIRQLTHHTKVANQLGQQ